MMVARPLAPLLLLLLLAPSVGASPAEGSRCVVANVGPYGSELWVGGALAVSFDAYEGARVEGDPRAAAEACAGALADGTACVASALAAPPGPTPDAHEAFVLETYRAPFDIVARTIGGGWNAARAPLQATSQSTAPVDFAEGAAAGIWSPALHGAQDAGSPAARQAAHAFGPGSDASVACLA